MPLGRTRSSVANRSCTAASACSTLPSLTFWRSNITLISSSFVRPPLGGSATPTPVGRSPGRHLATRECDGGTPSRQITAFLAPHVEEPGPRSGPRRQMLDTRPDPTYARGGAVTTTSVSEREPAVSAERSWAVRLLTTTEPGRRNRRTIDSVVLAVAALVLGLSATIASSAHEEDESVAGALA